MRRVVLVAVWMPKADDSSTQKGKSTAWRVCSLVNSISEFLFGHIQLSSKLQPMTTMPLITTLEWEKGLNMFQKTKSLQSHRPSWDCLVCNVSTHHWALEELIVERKLSRAARLQSKTLPWGLDLYIYQYRSSRRHIVIIRLAVVTAFTNPVSSLFRECSCHCFPEGRQRHRRTNYNRFVLSAPFFEPPFKMLGVEITLISPANSE